MKHAHYEIVDPPNEPYCVGIPGLQGVLATGGTLEECCANLENTLDAWLMLGLQLGHRIPEMDGIALERLKVSA